MDRITLSNIPSDFRSERDIETALAWSAVKHVLEERGKLSLFASITSVKVTEKYITLTTKKPIVNEELSYYKKRIEERYSLTARRLSNSKKSVRLI